MTRLVGPAKRTKGAFTLQDLAEKFGPMSPARIRFDPAPGTATQRDLAQVLRTEKRLYELVDGTLVEKIVGHEESEVAIWLAVALGNFIGPRKLGSLTGADGAFQLKLRLVRMPDVAFVSRARYPQGKRPRGAIAKVVPNLVVEVISQGNTALEMRAKLREYFRAGVELVWLIDHRKRTCEVFTSPSDRTVLSADQTITGGTVLPGFELSLSDLFARLDDV